ncbi:MAG: D-amino acid aminotransferase [Gemmatimonadota bacterium]|nr:D-amino acid aminotransferase [Gemmatimonadota bacterium]MDH5759559.1 D-amino acid aminotransferase [Gemmatimonadota bacterium]
MSTVFLNGEYLPKDEAKISVDDRGFLFADGVYEVTPFYAGVPFHLERHLDRLRRGLAWMRIDFDVESLVEVHERLLDENGVRDAESSLVYLQITRGVAPRSHPFPAEPVEPTVYAFAKAWTRPSDETWEKGYTAITIPDRRWTRVDVKTIALLPNVFAYQAAVDAGVTDAIQVRDGIALEGAHNNFFGVFDGTVVTHPKTNVILPGVTRSVVLELAAANGIPVEERPIQVEELPHADELFFTGTSSEVRPTVEVDGRKVGDGKPGPVTRALSKAFMKEVERMKGIPRG